MNKILYLLFIFFSSLAYASDQLEPIIQYGDRFHPVPGEKGMVVSQERIASQVGADILAQGGNAADAAVATGFALAVTLPQAGNIGGGGFMLLYLAKQDKTIAIDYREMAPAAAIEDLFLDDAGNVDQQKARFSHQSAGVPGTVAGLLHVQQQYGRLSLKEVLQPAIKLAKNGLVVDYPFSQAISSASKRLSANPASSNYFLDEQGREPQPGALFKQTDLAKTLTRISRKGRDGFYRGKTADLIVEDMKANGGLITHADLESYRVVERIPVASDFSGYRIVSMPPPSSGGVHLIQILNILEGYEPKSLQHNSAQYLHYFIEAARRAYADRSQYLGDTDFYAVPVNQLISKEYAAYLQKQIDPSQASLSVDVEPALSRYEESPQTTHYSVWDSDGNVVSSTYTLNFSFGSGISVPGAGFLLNNEMDDFSAKPGAPNAYGLLGNKANAISPGKRPLSSMTPTLVFKDGKPVLATGSPGGSTIITVVAQVILNMLVFDMNVAEATAVPRIHHQWFPDVLAWEQGISPDTRQRLAEMGHILRPEKSVLGRVQSIERQGKILKGYSDNRWPGGAAIPAEQGKK